MLHISENSCFAFKDKNTLTKSRAIDHLIASKIQQHFIHYSQHIRLILKIHKFCVLMLSRGIDKVVWVGGVVEGD